MKPSTYVDAAMRTDSDMYPYANDRLIHAGMGLVTEAAEFIDALKKNVFYGKPLDKVNLSEELGDVLWYVALACDELGVSMEHVMETNLAKLMKRYPEKFSSDKAINRDVDNERGALE